MLGVEIYMLSALQSQFSFSYLAQFDVYRRKDRQILYRHKENHYILMCQINEYIYHIYHVYTRWVIAKITWPFTWYIG